MLFAIVCLFVFIRYGDMRQSLYWERSLQLECIIRSPEYAIGKLMLLMPSTRLES